VGYQFVGKKVKMKPILPCWFCFFSWREIKIKAKPLEGEDSGDFEMADLIQRRHSKDRMLMSRKYSNRNSNEEGDD